MWLMIDTMTSSQPIFVQHELLYRLLTLQGHDVQILPIILGTQGTVFEWFQKAMTALAVFKSNQKTLARRLNDHALLSSSKIIRSKRHLEYTALGPKASINYALKCAFEEYCLWLCQWQMRIKCVPGRLVNQTPRDVRLTSSMICFIHYSLIAE